MEATLNVVTAMGAKAHWVDTNHLRIDPIDEIPATATLDCGESGSTLRFLFPVAAALGSNGFTFTGRGKLPQRPMEPLRSEIVSHGALCKGAMLPMTISGQLHGGNYTLPEISVPNTFQDSSLLFLYCWKTVSFTWHQNRNPKHTLQ